MHQCPKSVPCAAVALLGVLMCGRAFAQAPVPTADDLLRLADKQATSFKDATFHFKMHIFEPGGQVREVEFTSVEKGQKRLVRFLNPGDIKGMGILVENPDSMYALLPAFGNRVRRVGTHQKSQAFFGSDLSAEDMSAIQMGPLYSAKLAGTEGEQSILELTPKPGVQTEFAHLKLWVETKTGTVTKIEYYDSAGKKARTQLRNDFRQVSGTSYRLPYRLTFIDHRRNNHKTELEMLDAKLDTGMADDMFNQRALQRQ